MSPKLTPTFPPTPLTTTTTTSSESPSTQSLITALHLEKHIEGGYFAELDRNPLLIPNPFLPPTTTTTTTTTSSSSSSSPGANAVRNASTSIYYLLTPTTPQGCFHRNKGRTVHTLIEGRGRYVVVHADEGDEGDGEDGGDVTQGGKKRVESFVVGRDVSKGEKSVWIVEGGKFKASYLLEGEGVEKGEARLLISETVIPGFEYEDHDFLDGEKFKQLVTREQAEELEWLVRKA